MNLNMVHSWNTRDRWKLKYLTICVDESKYGSFLEYYRQVDAKILNNMCR